MQTKTKTYVSLFISLIVEIAFPIILFLETVDENQHLKMFASNIKIKIKIIIPHFQIEHAID